jgi:tetratricopeptide (TPR) repeat protein
MYEEIEWADGVEKIRDAIQHARQQEKKYNAEQERLRLLEEKRRQEEEEVETQVRLSETETREKTRKEKETLAGRQKRQQAKDDAQNQVYAKLEEANSLVASDEYDDAIALIQEALELFADIEDPIQEGQVRDLIQDVRRKKADYIQHQEIEQKRQQGRMESEREQEELIRKAEEERRQRQSEERAKSMEKMNARKQSDELSNQAYALLDRAEALFNQGKATQAIAKLKEVQEFFEQLGWEKELKALTKRIAKKSRNTSRIKRARSNLRSQ